MPKPSGPALTEVAEGDEDGLTGAVDEEPSDAQLKPNTIEISKDAEDAFAKM